MSKKYESLAHELITKIGGKENILDVYHCQTRLRFKLKDVDKAEQEVIATMDGVARVVVSAGVFQVVIGVHVADVFEEIAKLVDLHSPNEVQTIEKGNFFMKLVDFVAGTFQPVVPALSGAGMVKAVLALLVVFKVITTDSQTYYLLNLFADGVFFFLPMLLAFSQAQKLKCNPILAVAVASIMMHPNWTALVNAKEAVNFFGVIPFTLVTYTSSVIPIILIIFVQSYVEKILYKWIPKAVEIVFVPMFTILIMGTLAFSVLGPLGSIAGGYLAQVFNFLSVNVSWAPALLIGGFLPLMVMFGLHNAVAPLGIMQMADLGYDSIFGPGCVCSNIAQATAASVVAFGTKDKKLKQLATSGSITAYMGITEPVLYGVNLPKKYPLVAAMIGGGFGGLYAGITHTHRFATGSSGLPAVLLYIGDDTMTYFINILIALCITVVITAVVTYVLSLKYEKEENADQVTFTSPLKGKVVALNQVADEVFASEVMGKGVAIEPIEGRVVAPSSGTVVSLFPTKHAIGLLLDSGVEVLIHIGINTVELQGKYFDAKVAQGDRVISGQTLVDFDLEAIQNAGYSTSTMIIITNTQAYQSICVVGENQVEPSNHLLTLAK